jgi:hypothetical protein
MADTRRRHDRKRDRVATIDEKFEMVIDALRKQDVRFEAIDRATSGLAQELAGVQRRFLGRQADQELKAVLDRTPPPFAEQGPRVGSGVGSANSGSAPQPPQPPLANDYERLESRLMSLHQELSYLEDRLDPIMAQSPPAPASTGGGASSASPTGMSKFSAMFCSTTINVENAADRVRRLLARLEI